MAWQMLQWLHFARMDDLAKGVLVVVVLGVAAGTVILVGVRAGSGGGSESRAKGIGT